MVFVFAKPHYKHLITLYDILPTEQAGCISSPQTWQEMLQGLHPSQAWTQQVRLD